METFLRKMMQTAGKAVEKIGHMKSPKSSPSSSAKPQVAEVSRSQFPPENQLRRWVEALEQKEVAQLIPNLAGKSVIQATTSGNRIWDTLSERDAEFIIDLDMGNFEGSPSGQKPTNLQRVKANLLAAPFPDQSIDYFVLLGAGIRREDPAVWMKEMARVLKDGSRLVLSFLHPFVEYQFQQGASFQHR